MASSAAQHAEDADKFTARFEEPAVVREKHGYILLTTWTCPYSQRCWIVLNEKEVKFKTVFVDLDDKPEWLFKYNEHGRVPTLVWHEALDEGQQEAEPRCLYESLVVNEFLEEAHPTPPLLPQDPYKRARARLLIDQSHTKVAAHVVNLMFGKDELSAKAAAGALSQGLRWLEGQIDCEGPFILGTDFSLVDAALIPFIVRLEPVKVLRGFSVPGPDELPRLARWSAAASQRRSVKVTMQPPHDQGSYVEQLVEHSRRWQSQGQSRA